MFEFSRPALPQLDLSNSLGTVADFINQLQSAIASAIQHPFIAVLILFVGIGLLQLIADLVKRILKASIAFVLTLPLTLSQWLWQRATTASTPSKETQIEQLLDRLDTLKTEEAQIITTLKSLLTADKLTVDRPNSTVPTSLALQANLDLQAQPEEQTLETTSTGSTSTNNIKTNS